MAWDRSLGQHNEWHFIRDELWQMFRQVEKKIKQTKNNEKAESQNQAEFGMLRHNVFFFCSSLPRDVLGRWTVTTVTTHQRFSNVGPFNQRHLLHLNTFIQLSSDSLFVCSVNTCTLYHFSYVAAHILFSILLIKENCGIAQSVERLPGLTFWAHFEAPPMSLSFHAGHQKVSRCHTRGESEGMCNTYASTKCE